MSSTLSCFTYRSIKSSLPVHARTAVRETFMSTISITCSSFTEVGSDNCFFAAGRACERACVCVYMCVSEGSGIQRQPQMHPGQPRAPRRGTRSVPRPLCWSIKRWRSASHAPLQDATSFAPIKSYVATGRVSSQLMLLNSEHERPFIVTNRATTCLESGHGTNVMV